MDDQVMPLPDIRLKHKKWKSCGNVTIASNGGSCSSIFKPHQLQQRRLELVGGNGLNNTLLSGRRLSPPKKIVHFPEVGDGLGRPGRSRARNASADDIEMATRPPSLVLLRRQGRQLSDPSLCQGKLLLARSLSTDRTQKKYLVVEHRSSRALEGLHLETRAIQQQKAPSRSNGIRQQRRRQDAIINGGAGGGGGGGGHRFLSPREAQELKAAQRLP